MVAGALAMDDTQERSPSVLLLDEGSAAINEQRGAVTEAPEHRAGRTASQSSAGTQKVLGAGR
jgi:hypothetical protein